MRYVLPPQGFFDSAPKLQFVPILVDDDGTYPVEANRYLDERCNGEWSPDSNDDEDSTILTVKSRMSLVSRLSAFLRWCKQNEGREWRKLEYSEDLLGKYQPGLLAGTAAPSQMPLGPASVNLYVDEARLFLRWAAERGYRGPFKVQRKAITITRSSGAHALSHKGIQVHKRVGSLQSTPFPIDDLPLTHEVATWLREVSLRHGVKALIFEFMLRTGARISEANELRVTCFPSKTHGPNQDQWKQSWYPRGWVPLTLKYGVKGGKVQPASTLSVRTRTVEVPLDLADRIWDYIRIVRPTLLSRYHRSPRLREPKSDRLWLGETKCQPVSNQMLYDVWTKARTCPPGWHPHAARHFFAVERVLGATRQMLEFHRVTDLQGCSMGWLHGLMAGQVRLLLSPLLGHCDETTSMQYLQFAMRRMIREFGLLMSNQN